MDLAACHGTSYLQTLLSETHDRLNMAAEPVGLGTMPSYATIMDRAWLMR